MTLGSSRIEQIEAIISSLSWLDWLALVVILVLLGSLAFIVWRRKYAKSDSKPAITVPEKPLLKSNSLLKVWQNFVNAIPWHTRSAALDVPLSLVIGEAGCGKTAIIDQYTDWLGQYFRFHPSATDDPLLQIYLGAKALALEFSSSLIYDTSPATYHALQKLWKHLPTNPQAILVIDVATLLEPQPDRLRQSGQALFGKLEVFGELEGEPLPLILALTHMEKVQGFMEFCVFLEEAGIPLQIDFPEKDGVTRLSSCLKRFEQYLSRALVMRPAQDYLKIVNFLSEAPHLLDVLGEFLRLAGMEQSSCPPIVRLCLLSEQIHSFGCHPFAAQPSTVEQSPFTLNAHAKAALALLLVGTVYLVGGYNYQKGLLTEIQEKIELVHTTSIDGYAEKVSPLFLDFSLNLHKNALLSFMPNYFPHIDHYSKLLLIRAIREYYLLPILRQVQFEENATFKTNRMLGLLYATPNNGMGDIILKHMRANPTDSTFKYRQLINDYVSNNSHTDELDAVLNGISYAKPKPYIEDHTVWLVLFRNFQQILKSPFIQDVEFTKLQQQTVQFLGILNQLDYYTDQAEVVQWLKQNTNLRLDLQTEYNSQSQLQQEGISKLLTFVNNLVLGNTSICPSTTSLNQCIAQVQVVAAAKINTTPNDMAFVLDGEYFSFTTRQWTDLLTRSRVVMMLRNIMASHRNYDGWVFFDSPSVYPDLQMNAGNDGTTLFAGKARIDGRLTSDAFDQQVKPAIMALSDIVDKLPIDADEKKRFNNFVLTNLRTYSDNYVSAYLNYFRQFQVRMDSVWALNYVLDELQQPSSPLLDTLVQIKNNTALNLPTSPYFQAFAQKLTAFRFVQRLMEEKNGVYPEFQKYQIIMSQMQNDLNSRDPYVPKKSDDAGSLKAALTPMGRTAWAMLLNEDSSYAKLVKSWLQNAGMLDYWQQPFLAPVQKVSELGTVEIKQTIDGIWSDIWNSNVQPLFVKFPFQLDAGRDKELAVDELIKTFQPKNGVFWVTFEQYLAPLCSLNNGVWVKRQELSDTLSLPSNYLKRLNAVQQLTANLWDDQGNQKALQLSIKPSLLPTFDSKQIPDAPLVSLTYLRNGGVSVLGFNQQAAWQKLALEWWTAQPAEAGMEFRKDEDPDRVYADVTVSDSPWNFFRLLQQAQATNNTRYQWPLAHPKFPQQKLNVEFIFQNNPWAVFTNLSGS